MYVDRIQYCNMVRIYSNVNQLILFFISTISKMSVNRLNLRHYFYFLSTFILFIFGSQDPFLFGIDPDPTHEYFFEFYKFRLQTKKRLFRNFFQVLKNFSSVYPQLFILRTKQQLSWLQLCQPDLSFMLRRSSHIEPEHWSIVKGFTVIFSINLNISENIAEQQEVHYGN